MLGIPLPRGIQIVSGAFCVPLCLSDIRFSKFNNIVRVPNYSIRRLLGPIPQGNLMYEIARIGWLDDWECARGRSNDGRLRFRSRGRIGHNGLDGFLWGWRIIWPITNVYC